LFIQTDQVEVTLHYYRFDGQYEDWNIWAWPYELSGTEYRFSGTDDFGAVARFTLEAMNQAPKIGFIVRRSVPGNDWSQREIGDRFIERADDGRAEIWVIQGDRNVYYDRTTAFENRTPRIVFADMTNADTVTAELNKPDPPECGWEMCFRLRNGTGGDHAEVPLSKVEIVESAEARGMMRFRLTTAEPLSLENDYKLECDGWSDADVTCVGMFDSPRFHKLFTYQGDDLGAVYHSSHTNFRLWAPTAAEARVMLYESWDAADGQSIRMCKAENGTWVAAAVGNQLGKFYTYRVKINGLWKEATDPYAPALSVNGYRGAIIDALSASPPGWSEDRRPRLEHPVDAIFYELHVRDSTVHPASGVKCKGKYLGLAEQGTSGPSGHPTGLDYLAFLGITHVQLLPVSDFVSVDERRNPPERYNWGYDPGHYMVPDGSYATNPYDPAVRIREFKRLVQALHERGIRVVMDVVFNHMYSPESSNLGKLVPGYYFRRGPDGRLSCGSGVGNDTASERPMMRKLIVDSVVRWANEYHIDGFRFDLMGIHDVRTMNAVREALDAIDPSIQVYGEGWRLNTALPDAEKANQTNAHRMPRIGQFHDMLRDGLKGDLFNDADRGFINGGGVRTAEVKSGIVGGIRYSDEAVSNANEPEQTINFAEVHDNLTLWDKLQLSNPEDSEETRSRMHRLATSILLTSQGIPLLHAGQEFYRTKYGEHNSYRSPDEINRLDWERMAAHADSVEYVKGLIAIRRSLPLLRLHSAGEIRERLQFLDAPEGTVAYLIQGVDADELAAVAHNGTRSPAALKLPVSYEGSWKLLCDGERAGIQPLAKIEASCFNVPPLSTCLWIR
jgi:pullulanase